MIFVTVGTELPFDRMLRVVDQWAGEASRGDIFAQIGETAWHPRHMSFASFLEPPDFAARVREASMIVSHAGMGTILSALRHGKPIVVMPRLASLGEQRNEHQLATARRLSQLGKVEVAFDEADLRAKLDAIETLQVRATIGDFAGQELIAGLREFILGHGMAALGSSSGARRDGVPSR